MLRRLSDPNIPYSAQEILSHVRVSSQDEVPLVETYLREALDCIEVVCERAIGFAEYELVISGLPFGIDDTVGPLPFTTQHRATYPGSLSGSYTSDRQFDYLSAPAVELRLPPVLQVSSFQYYDQANDLQTWDAANYALEPSQPALVYPAENTFWPVISHRRDAVRIQFWAGETDELEFNAAGTPQFRSLSGFPWQDGQRLTLRASGNRNSAFGDLAMVPEGFRDYSRYFVRDSDDAGSFNLAATDGGPAITGAIPVTGILDRLYAGQMSGVVAAGIRKVATDSFINRCSEGTCSCSGMDANDFAHEPHLRKMLWRSPMTVS